MFRDDSVLLAESVELEDELDDPLWLLELPLQPASPHAKTSANDNSATKSALLFPTIFSLSPKMIFTRI